jgi:hypothetical protein
LRKPSQAQRASTGLIALGLILLAGACVSPPAPPEKPRLLVLTDIGNEPDDSQSLLRLLLYANELELEGLIATTSIFQPDKTQPQLIRERITAYGEVLPNLRRHARGYPEADRLFAIIRTGSPQLGMAGVGTGKDTDGSAQIIRAADRDDPRPLHISIWGGAADLAQALWTVRETRGPDSADAFARKLRVYSISDQDDAGPWIRAEFPGLVWIGSVHGTGPYDQPAWNGISKDLSLPEKWPAADMVTNDWLAASIRKGPLGALYPPHKFIMEGDTPAFLWLLPNGANVPGRIDWGGWGGRYAPLAANPAYFGDAFDLYTDETGREWNSNLATVFRWREAFQNDFAARIAWSVADAYGDANHPPALSVNGQRGLAPVEITAKPGETIRLSARGSRDPDGDTLRFRWWHYPEPGGQAEALQSAAFSAPNAPETSLALPDSAAPQTFHIILEVTDSGTPPLTRYRRVLVRTAP